MPAAKKWGMNGIGRGRSPRKNSWDHAFLCQETAFLPTGNTLVYSRGNAVQMQLNVKEQRDCQDLGILMTNVANKVMSARYGSNETLVSTSHSRKVPTQRKVTVSKAGNFIRY